MRQVLRTTRQRRKSEQTDADGASEHGLCGVLQAVCENGRLPMGQFRARLFRV